MRDTGRGKSRLHAGSLTWDSIPGLPGSHSGLKAALNPQATRAAPYVLFRLSHQLREVVTCLWTCTCGNSGMDEK